MFLVPPCVALWAMLCPLFLEICEYKLLPYDNHFCIFALPYLIKTNPWYNLEHNG